MCWGTAGGPLFACQVRGDEPKEIPKSSYRLSKYTINCGLKFCVELRQQPCLGWKRPLQSLSPTLT